MRIFSQQRVLCVFVAAVLFAWPKQGAAGVVQAAAPNVVYKAMGTFLQPPVSGTDLFRLQGEPFNISVTANAASVPIHSGLGFAVYSPLTMTGTVKSGLLSAPTNISSRSASIELESGPQGEFFTVASPIRVVGLQVTIKARIKLPPGTLTTLYVHPFTAPVTMSGANATMTYSNETSDTVLGISGQLTTTVQTAARASAQPGTEQQRRISKGEADAALPRRRWV